ncbi:flagellar biosynthesis protein FlhB [Thioalkalicoccus limnaeus]|uniref:Flagellar biosynthetic protein FlhB n=1 Tax=Thioalkalicoccus limnaeus TaxID=120681 RepID=A0ABV4BHL7_9GAMM
MDKKPAQERTEQPTPKRLLDAKKKGQVPRSRELNTAMILTVGALILFVLGPTLGKGLSEVMAEALVLHAEDLDSPMAMVDRLARVVQQTLVLFAPFGLAMVITALISPALLGGWAVSAQSLQPKLERLDPIKGLGRMVSARALVEFVKAIAKLVLVAGVGGGYIWAHRSEILAPPKATVMLDIIGAFQLFGVLLILLAAATFLIAFIDVPFQLWDHTKKLRMTRQEVRDELKETEGRPEVKSRIRQLQREFARRRMMEEVPTADVVVTNPTHVAVALRYDALKSGAPRVVAKGADLVAGRVRALAEIHGVEIIEAPPLARALYHQVKLGQEIPASLYLAVAQLLAYVFQLRAARKAGTRQPERPRDLPVPDQ